MSIPQSALVRKLSGLRCEAGLTISSSRALGMVSGGMMLFDDYTFAAAAGEKQAVDEFLRISRGFPSCL
jgi:hypothetical protein